ncbi:MAG: AMP-binding protein [Deltaproteobacteria bacterium]|nr:AMP-binding protein [Deltaproteobacteria bacterium]
MTDAAINLADYVVGQRLRQGRGNAVALVTPEGHVTYAQVWRHALSAAAVLRQRGLRTGDRVLLALPDGVDFVAVLFGTLAAGGVVVMMNPEATNVADVAAYVGARVVVDTQALPRWRHDVGQAVPLPHAQAITADAHAFWLLTSGSTGDAKAAMHRHGDFIAHIEIYAKGVLGLTEHDRTMAVSKLHFPYATGMNLLFPLAVGGSCVLYPQRAPAPELLALAAKYQPTIFCTVPTMTARLLALPAQEQSALAHVRLAVTAGEALPPDLLAKWQAQHAAPLLDGIGSAEMFHVYITNRPDDVRPACLGRVVPGYETRVVGEDGADVAPGDVGLLWVRGPSAGVGYHDDPARTARVFLPGGWVVTGDMFRKTADGYHHYEGRSDDLMKVAGLYVSPLEVEAVLRQHPAIKDCAVVAHADEHGLVKPRAFVVLEPPAVDDQALFETLAAFAREHLLGYKVPRSWVSLPELPRNDRGKVLRRRLREDERDGARLHRMDLA